jgi:hypothetical protein
VGSYSCADNETDYLVIAEPEIISSVCFHCSSFWRLRLGSELFIFFWEWWSSFRIVQQYYRQMLVQLWKRLTKNNTRDSSRSKLIIHEQRLAVSNRSDVSSGHEDKFSVPVTHFWRHSGQLDLPIGLWDIEASMFSRKLAHRWRWSYPYAPTALYSRQYFWYSFGVRGWVNLRIIVRLEGIGKLKESGDLAGNRTCDLPTCSASGKTRKVKENRTRGSAGALEPTLKVLIFLVM